MLLIEAFTTGFTLARKMNSPVVVVRPKQSDDNWHYFVQRANSNISSKDEVVVTIAENI